MMILNAGDKVRITQHAFENSELDVIVIATEGSLATVLSYAEFCDHFHKIGAGASKEYFAHVKNGMEAGRRYPVRFVKVVSPSKEFLKGDEETGPVNNACKVRRVCLLEVRFLEKV